MAWARPEYPLPYASHTTVLSGACPEIALPFPKPRYLAITVCRDHIIAVARPSGPITKARYIVGSGALEARNARLIRRSQRDVADNDGSGVLLARIHPEILLPLTTFRCCPQCDTAQEDKARQPRDHHPNQKPLQRSHRSHRPPLKHTPTPVNIC